MQTYSVLQEHTRSRSGRVHLLLIAIAATRFMTVLSLSASLPAAAGKSARAGVAPSHAPFAISLYHKRLLFQHVHPSGPVASGRLNNVCISSHDNCIPKQGKAAAPNDRTGVVRLHGFSLLLNPDAAATEQQLERMHSSASRHFARLWAESGVQQQLRQRCRYSRRVTRGQGGRREVLRRRLQGRMLLRQQKEQSSRVLWQEPLQLKQVHLEMLIKALKSNGQVEALKGGSARDRQGIDGSS